jgi:hypothetical protein
MYITYIYITYIYFFQGQVEKEEQVSKENSKINKILLYKLF